MHDKKAQYYLNKETLMICKECIHHRQLENSTHFKCISPLVIDPESNIESETLKLLGIEQDPKLSPNSELLDLIVDIEGVMKGKFNWPFNFDPYWVKRCNGFVKEAL